MRYHAARGLIYLGCLDVGGVYLFKRVPGTKAFSIKTLCSVSTPQVPLMILVSESFYYEGGACKF